MDIRTQIRELINAQDIVRQVYVQQNQPDKDKALRQLDKHMSKVINLIGNEIKWTQ